MVLLGEKVKERRVERGITQAALAEGVCTQATISNLEKNSSIPSLSTLLELLRRLDMDVAVIGDYLKDDLGSYTEIFTEVKNLCGLGKYSEAKKLLLGSINFADISNSFQKKQYYYYLGLTSLLAENDFSEAHFDYNQALAVESNQPLDIIDVLATNGIGTVYFQQGDLKKSITYIQRSVQQLEEVTEQNNYLLKDSEIIKVYYNNAKVFAALGEYQKAFDLCEFGIQLQTQQNELFGLEQLLYEKASILYQLGAVDEAQKNYAMAASFALFNHNNQVLQMVQKDCKQLKIKPFNYLG